MQASSAPESPASVQSHAPHAPANQGALARLQRLVRAEGAPLLFVWLVWLVQSWLLLGYVSDYGVNIPFLDEWEMVPALTGEQPITLSWLWSQHNEHRIFLPRLIYMTVTTLSGTSFRAGMFFDVFVLSAMAAVAQLTARSVRGRSLYSDAFFPLLILSWGQTENLLWSFQIQFVCGSAVVLAALCALARPGPVRLRNGLCVGICSVLLPLFGANGLALAPALVLCALSMAWQLRVPSDKGDRRWLYVAASGVAGIITTVLYFVGYHKHPGHPMSPNLESTVLAMRQILSIGFGSGTRSYFPEDQYVLPGLIAVTVVALLVRFARAPAVRLHVLRLGLLMGGLLTLIAGIGYARIAIYTWGVFNSRYATLTAPLVCALYFAWELVENRQVRRFAQMTLFFIAAMLVIRNRDAGIIEGGAMRGAREAALNDVRNGVPLSEVAARHCGSLYLCGSPNLATRMKRLQAEGIGEFAGANPQ
jgi:hypothetical protein